MKYGMHDIFIFLDVVLYRYKTSDLIAWSDAYEVLKSILGKKGN